jgi:hypothetical protein
VSSLKVARSLSCLPRSVTPGRSVHGLRNFHLKHLGREDVLTSCVSIDFVLNTDHFHCITQLCMRSGYVYSFGVREFPKSVLCDF